MIKNFQSVLSNEALLENTKTEIHCKLENVDIAKFTVFTKKDDDDDYVSLWGQLTYKHDSLNSVLTKFVTTIPKTANNLEVRV